MTHELAVPPVLHDLADPPVLPITEAARRLGISRSNAYNLAKNGLFPIPVLRPSPRRLVVSSAALRAYISQGAA